ncbi:Creatinine amidohydrolase [Streptomyces netropsis]|uniref:Creatinine amidohydrolase n=1 Tax=Streptomyces syringium TaxID=76729 RepID=A0ABS4YDR2_9ACTN|nr:creatininase family protein [Streptomyces syringium]MBP2406557.1 creatinine amidohydrolase [Streptomyces syringium]SPE63548.1 Creatinine amidohydrolase [Streptomyces netropsis]
MTGMRQRTTNVAAYGDLTSPEVPGAVSGATLVWPVGGLEQHGPHLPLSVDFDIPDALARQVVAEVGGLLLPGQPFSARSLPQSGGGLHFPGTVHIGGGTFVDYLTHCLRALARLEPARLVVINGHYENEGLLFEAIDGCEPARTFPHTEIVAFSWWSLVEDEWLGKHVPEFPGWHAEHAGLTETSLMMYLRPDVVRAARPTHDTPPPPGIYRHPVDVDRMSNQGVLSSTTGADAELGEKLFWHVLDGITRTLSDSSTGPVRPADPAPA